MSDYVLDWDTTGSDGSASVSSTSGGEDVTVTVATPTNYDGDSFQLTGGLLTSDFVCKDTSALVTFDTEVSNVTFSLYDVDANYDWDDKVTIIAKDAEGNTVPVQFSDLTYLQTVSGNTVEGTQSGDYDVAGPGDGDTITVTIAGPIVSLEIVHDNGDSDANSGVISVGDISFDAAAPDLDGIVEGTAADDVIDIAYTGDPDGDRIDAGDAVLPGEGPDDDIVEAGDGDDVVEAGAGDDEIYGGGGDDDLSGGAGNDTIYGDSTYGPAEEVFRESFEWDLAPDPNGPAPIEDGDKITGFTQNTGHVDVTFSITGTNECPKTEFADNAQNVAAIDDGAETVDATSSLASELDSKDEGATYALDFSDPVSNVSFRVNDIDGDGVVTVTAYDAEGTPTTVNLTAGAGLTLLDTDGVPGADTADSNGGYDSDTSPTYSVLVDIPGPVSKIVIEHAQNGGDNSGINVTDVFFDVTVGEPAGGPGDDHLFGGDGSDILYGEDGDDRLDGGANDDDADTLIGGDDADTFTGAGIGDDVQGGAGGNDDDTLDLTGSTAPGGSLKVTVAGPDSDGNGYDGFVTYFDDAGDETGTLTFSNIENIIPCFTPGTTIATPKGERLVEDLREGDKVITRDNGIQEIRWMGRRALNGRDLTLARHLKPILVRAGALGNGLPERDMLVSPNHRVLVANDRTALYFEEREVLVAAKHLVNNRGVHVIDTLSTTYIHFMFDQHEVVLSNGAWTESFQPGDWTLSGMGNAQRNEIFELFPELKSEEGREGYTAARKTLKKHEARLLSL